MKVSIITVYNTENCGSYWQAYALGRVIEKNGNEVGYVERDMSLSSGTYRHFISLILRRLCKFDFIGVNLLIRQRRAFKESRKSFKVIERGSDFYNSTDCFVYGSDTIWNFNSQYFYNHWDEYVGKLEGDCYKISYAPAIANTSEFFLTENSKIAESIKLMNDISVRDESTRKFVKNGTGRDVQVVCDPTLLLSGEEYTRILEDAQFKKIFNCKYIVIYHFKELSKVQISDIRHIAKVNKLKIVSIGEHRSWCDKSVPYDPFLFLNLISNARFVVTNTFHGTIFSVIFRKSFVSNAVNKNKVVDFLASIGLENRLWHDTVSLLELFENVEYSAETEGKIEKLISESYSFLVDSIENARKR